MTDLTKLTLPQAIRAAKYITLFHVNLELDINKKQARRIIQDRGGAKAWENPYQGGECDSWSFEDGHLFLHMKEA